MRRHPPKHTRTYTLVPYPTLVRARTAAERAWLGLPEVTIGLIPGAGGTQRLTRLCGKGVASRMSLTGDPVRGAEALGLGLVQWAVPRDDLPEQAAKLRSEEHTSELQSLMRISYAVFCLKKKIN